MHTFSKRPFVLQALPTIGSSKDSSGPRWVRDASGRLNRQVNTPIPEEVETRVTDAMAEKRSNESSSIDPNEPRYTRAEVESMVNEMLAAKLAEFGLTPQSQTQTSSSGLGKGKEPEIFDPELKEQDADYHRELLERTRAHKRVVNVPKENVGEKFGSGEELKEVKKEMRKISAQLQAKNDFGYDFEDYVGDESGKGPSEKLHKPAKFDGDGDPVVHLNQYALIAKLNRLSPQFMLDWFSTSLQGPALIWYHSLDKSKKSSWLELSKAFLDHFSFNTTLNVGLRELETTVQKRDEPFIDYLTRWRKRLILIKHRPDESELIEMFIKGTLPEFRNKLYFIPLKDFAEVYKMGIRIENQLNEERRANVRSGFSGNRGGGVVNKPMGTSRTGSSKVSV